MESLTIKLSHQLSARVTRLAKRRHISRSALVREALELLTADRRGETFVDLVSQHIGSADDLPADIVSNSKHMKGYGVEPNVAAQHRALAGAAGTARAASPLGN